MSDLIRLPPSRRAMRRRIVNHLFMLLSLLFAGLWVLTAERTLRGLNGMLDDALQPMVEIMRDAARQSTAQLKSINDDHVFFELRDLPNGELVARSSALNSDDNLLGGHSWKWVERHDGEEGWNAFGGGDYLRCAATKINVPVEEDSSGGTPRYEQRFLIVAVEREQADRRYSEILIRSGAGFIIALSLCLGLTWWIVRRGTKPLDNLARDVAAIGPDDLRPVRKPKEPELALVAERLNALLEEVAHSLEKEKRFSSDVAHELMTPIGGLRAELEVALRKPRDVEDWRAVANRCQAMVVELQMLVENLLELGRLERGAAGAALESIALRDTVERVWNAVKFAADERKIQFENRVPAPERVRANSALLDIVLSNLLKNVVRYTSVEGRAWVECARGKDGAGVEVLICNEAGQLPEHFTTSAFDRFWRGDASRTHKGLNPSLGPGAGLGLPLARSATRAMGANLGLEARPGPLVVFRLEFPN